MTLATSAKGRQRASARLLDQRIDGEEFYLSPSIADVLPMPPLRVPPCLAMEVC